MALGSFSLRAGLLILFAIQFTPIPGANAYHHRHLRRHHPHPPSSRLEGIIKTRNDAYDDPPAIVRREAVSQSSGNGATFESELVQAQQKILALEELVQTLMQQLQSPPTASSQVLNVSPALMTRSTTFLTSSLPPTAQAGLQSPTVSLNQPTAGAAASSSTSGTSNYNFNPMAANNIAVYYGQTAVTSQVKLTTLCQDPNVDIVILAFVTDYFGPGGYPSINMGANCYPATTAQQQAGATGLLDCSELAPQISTCQSIGKKVLLSLGGAISTSSIPSSTQATQLATTLWNLFGGGHSGNQDIRPFGNVSIDGFDIDNEDGSTTNYATFISALRSLFPSDHSKPYFISAAPQCPRPDASIPLSSMQSAIDFIWVQFYNNGPCNIGGTSFLSSLQSWSSDLASSTSMSSFQSVGNGVSSPRLYIGAPAFQGGGSGYLPGAQFAGVIGKARGLGLGNFGGVMLWDGSEGELNKDTGGNSYMADVKQALSG